MKVTIIGTGRVGSALAFGLKSAGYCIHALIDRNTKTAYAAGKKTGCKIIRGKITKDAIEGAGIIFIAVKDGGIKSVALELKKLNPGINTVIAHTSGVFSSGILEAAGLKKSNLASFHPIQTIPMISKKDNGLLSGIYFGIEGGTTALRLLKKTAGRLGSKYILIPGKSKAEYHLSCVLASNFIISNFYLNGLLAKSLGISEKKLFESQMPLLMNTIKNISKHGAVKAITGPVSRGDHETVKMHIDVLHGKYPDFIEYYKSVSGILLKAAKRNNQKLDDEKIIKLLEHE